MNNKEKKIMRSFVLFLKRNDAYSRYRQMYAKHVNSFNFYSNMLNLPRLSPFYQSHIISVSYLLFEAKFLDDRTNFNYWLELERKYTRIPKEKFYGQ